MNEKKTQKKSSRIATRDLWAEELPRMDVHTHMNCSEAGFKVVPEAVRFGSVEEVKTNRTCSQWTSF